jgi:hypothetical protein
MAFLGAWRSPFPFAMEMPRFVDASADSTGNPGNLVRP